MKVDKCLKNLFFIFAILYGLQGVLYKVGEGLGQFSLLVVLLICFFYFVKVNIQIPKKGYYVNILSLFIIMQSVSAVFGVAFSSDTFDNVIDPLKQILGALLPFYPFYYFSKQNMNLDSSFRLFFIICLLILIIRFLFFDVDGFSYSLDKEDKVKNIGYAFVSLLPYIYFLKNKYRLFFYLSLIVLEIFILLSVKRGAIVCGVIGMVLILYSDLKLIRRKHFVRSIFILLIFMTITSFFVYDIVTSNQLLQYRFEAALGGDSSGRDDIYNGILYIWANSLTTFEMFFGAGFGATLNLLGLLAHNDWLELLLSFGLFGVMMYIPIIYYPFQYFRNRRIDSILRYQTLLIGTLWLCITMFSMAYIEITSYQYMIILGYNFGKTNSIN